MISGAGSTMRRSQSIRVPAGKGRPRLCLEHALAPVFRTCGRSVRVSSKQRGGFTLLEVMIAVAILSLGLATIFGSSVFASRSTAHAHMVTRATLLARCRMTEVEAYLQVNQLPETDQTLDDPPETGGLPCCEAPFTCTARVERIELPQPADVSTAAGERLLGSAANAVRSQGSTSGESGGALSQLATAMGAMSGGPGSAGSGLASSGAPNLQAMATELLSGIYPTIKPVLEGAIRKVTVHVSWHEGTREYGFDLVQYVTNPGQTLAHGATMDAIDRALGGNGTPPSGGNVPPPGGNR